MGCHPPECACRSGHLPGSCRRTPVLEGVRGSAATRVSLLGPGRSISGATRINHFATQNGPFGPSSDSGTLVLVVPTRPRGKGRGSRRRGPTERGHLSETLALANSTRQRRGRFGVRGSWARPANAPGGLPDASIYSGEAMVWSPLLPRWPATCVRAHNDIRGGGPRSC